MPLSRDLASLIHALHGFDRARACSRSLRCPVVPRAWSGVSLLKVRKKQAGRVRASSSPSSGTCKNLIPEARTSVNERHDVLSHCFRAEDGCSRHGDVTSELRLQSPSARSAVTVVCFACRCWARRFRAALGSLRSHDWRRPHARPPARLLRPDVAIVDSEADARTPRRLPSSATCRSASR